MNALLVANWPFLLAFLAGVLLGMGVGWLLRSWREPAPPPLRAPSQRPQPMERREARVYSAPAHDRRADDSRDNVRHHDDFDAGVHADAPMVLLIDDRLEMLGIHAAYLRKHGYRTLLADSGTAGLAFARQYHPALIVLDHSMPDRTGVEVARELKGDPATAAIPILLMTALSYGAVGAAAMEAGCEAFLPKPIEPSRLLREIEARTRPPKH